MEKESIFIFHAGCIGFYVTFLYDVIRMIRRVFPHKGFVEAIEDLGYWAYLFTVVFLFLNKEGNGTVRWFAVAGWMMGMLLYRKLLGRHLVDFGANIFLRVKKCILKIVTPPINAAARGLKHIVCRWKRGIKQRLTIFQKVLRMSLGVRRTRHMRREEQDGKKGCIPKESTK